MARPNSIDVLLAATLIAVAGLSVAAYRRFQVPAPGIESVSPTRLVVNTDRRVVVHGAYLRPFLRVFVVPAGKSFSLPSVDPEAIEAGVMTASPTDLEVRLPPVGPGVYDLHLCDEFQQVGVVERAFSVVLPDYRRAVVAATVRFILPPQTIPAIAVGDRDVSKSGDPSAASTDDAVVTAVHVDPAWHEELEMRVASSDVGERWIWLGPRGRGHEVDLSLRVPIVMDVPGAWRYKGSRIRAGEELAFEKPGVVAHGTIVWTGDPAIAAGSGPR